MRPSCLSFVFTSQQPVARRPSSENAFFSGHFTFKFVCAYMCLAVIATQGSFPGLIPLVHAYLEYIDADPLTIEKVDK